MAADSGYDGFISYSHQHDAAIGPALQTDLQRLAKPWYKIRALTIFLDTADLSANPALWPSIEDGAELVAVVHPARFGGRRGVQVGESRGAVVD